MLENALNLRATKIYDTIYDENGKEQHKLNGPATEEAQAKQRMIEDAFKDWIFKDRERRESLVALYNEKFNCIRPREYDGSHIQFFGMNPEITLRPHQRNAIAHILYGHNTLLAHVVGAGKTYEMVAAAMEKKRLGLCSKTLVAVPNHLTGQFASEALKLYPNANILVTTQRDFEKSNRKRFCAKIATGNYDIVVIGHSQFEKIPLSDARKAEFIRKQIDELEMQLESMDNSDSRLTVKQLLPPTASMALSRNCRTWATRSNMARVWNTWLCAIKTLNEISALTGSTRAFPRQRCGSITANCTVCPPKCSRNTGRKTPRQNRNGSPQNYSPLCGERGISASCRAGIPKCPALWLATITTAPCCGKPTTARAQSAATFCCVRIFCCSADTSSRQNSYGKTILKLWMNCWPTRKMQKSKSNSLPASAKFCIAKNVSRNVPRGKKKSNH